MHAVDADPCEDCSAGRKLAGKADLVQVAALAAANGQCRGDTVVEGLDAVLAIVDADDVIAAVPYAGVGHTARGRYVHDPIAVHRGHSGDRIDVDGVVAPVAVDSIGGGTGAGDIQIVVALAQGKVEVFDTQIIEPDGHAKADQARRRQGAGLPGDGGRIVDGERVRRCIGAALDVDLCGHARERVSRVAHGNRVCANTSVDGRISGHGLDQDGVGPALCPKVGLVGVRARNGEGVVAAAQVDIQRFDILVGNAGGAQAGDGGRRQDPGIVSGIPGIIDSQSVRATLAVDDHGAGKTVHITGRIQVGAADRNGVPATTRAQRGQHAAQGATDLDRIGGRPEVDVHRFYRVAVQDSSRTQSGQTAIGDAGDDQAVHGQGGCAAPGVIHDKFVGGPAFAIDDQLRGNEVFSTAGVAAGTGVAAHINRVVAAARKHVGRAGNLRQ